MPYSSDNGKLFIDRTIIRIVKQLDTTFFKHGGRILDLGAGSGTYAKRYGSTWLSDKKLFRWTAVEIWEPYIEKFNLTELYDHVIQEDVRKYLKDFQAIKYDICFIGDLAEHMSKQDAVELVKNACEKATLVIISIPIVHYPQGEFEGNPYEAHVKDDWSHQEVMESFPSIFDYAKTDDIGVYLCSNNPGLMQTVLKPQIGVYAICKDEIKFVDRFYDSIQDADFISICDTGSTDGTYEALSEKVKLRTVHFGHEEEAKTCHVKATDGAMQVNRIHVNPWRFDDARNAALSLLPEEVDLCISIDFDETLQPNWRKELEDLIDKEIKEHGKVVTERLNHRFETIWNWDSIEPQNKSSHWHERIHIRRGFEWKLPVHEILVKGDLSETKIGWLPNWTMTQLPDTSKSRSNYGPLLEKSVLENPNIWRSWSFLAAERLNGGDFEGAMEAIEKAKSIKDADKAYLSYQASTFYEFKGMYDQAYNQLITSISLAPHVREYKYYLAKLYQKQGKLDQARVFAKLAGLVTEKTSGYEYNPEAWDDSFKIFCSSLSEFTSEEYYGI